MYVRLRQSTASVQKGRRLFSVMQNRPRRAFSSRHKGGSNSIYSKYNNEGYKPLFSMPTSLSRRTVNRLSIPSLRRRKITFHKISRRRSTTSQNGGNFSGNLLQNAIMSATDAELQPQIAGIVDNDMFSKCSQHDTTRN